MRSQTAGGPANLPVLKRATLKRKFGQFQGQPTTYDKSQNHCSASPMVHIFAQLLQVPVWDALQCQAGASACERKSAASWRPAGSCPVPPLKGAPLAAGLLCARPPGAAAQAPGQPRHSTVSPSRGGRRRRGQAQQGRQVQHAPFSKLPSEPEQLCRPRPAMQRRRRPQRLRGRHMQSGVCRARSQ